MIQKPSGSEQSRAQYVINIVTRQVSELIIGLKQLHPGSRINDLAARC